MLVPSRFHDSYAAQNGYNSRNTPSAMSAPDHASGLLSSWKEIAAYLRKSVRTVQRWEKELGLPLHRPTSADKRIVLAYQKELDRWARTHSGGTNGDGVHPDREQLRAIRNRATKRLKAVVRTARVSQARCASLQAVVQKLITEHSRRAVRNRDFAEIELLRQAIELRHTGPKAAASFAPPLASDNSDKDRGS